MSTELLTSCLDLMEVQGIASSAFQNYFLRTKTDLLDSEEVAHGLVVLIAHLEQDNDNPVALFGLLLDEARMGLENDSAYAAGFLGSVEVAVAAGLAAGALEQHHLLEFAAQYRRVGLPIPQSLIVDPDKMVPPEGMEGIDISKILENVARDIQAQGGSPYDVFTAIHEMSAAVPDEIQASLANHLVTLQDQVFERCALYLILSGSDLVQEAVIFGLSERLGTSGLQADTLTFLPIIRGWFPSGAIRASLDRLIKQARRKNLPAKTGSQEDFKVLEIVATVADGVGAQSIAVVFEHNQKFSVAMVLTKNKHGIKDAFVIPCETRPEAENIVMQLLTETGAGDISSSTLGLLLEGALADGITNGCLPAPGILDVLETCDLLDIRPQMLGLQELLEYVDPEHKVQKASAQTLGRWINSDIALDLLEPLTDSWFEDTEETRNAIATSRMGYSIETKIWKYLEGRRDIWARRFLQTAAVLHDAERLREWQTLTASAYGLMTGRPLKRIPLMKGIAYLTIEAGDAQMW